MAAATAPSTENRVTPPPPAPVLVFAYGTLRPDLYPSVPKRFGVTPVGPGTVTGPFRLLNLGAFPGVIKDEALARHPDGGSQLVGFVVETNNLRMLDGYEGYPYLYSREQVQVAMRDGKTLTAWIYTYQGGDRNLEEVPGADWENVIRRDKVGD